jgi:hypothetical protein
MIEAACHCGRVTLAVTRRPRTLTDCNCSICRRYAALWAYYGAGSVELRAPRGSLDSYSWNRRVRRYFRCRHCGCITHYASAQPRRAATIAVNARNFPPAVIAAARIRHFDGAQSWQYLD